MTLGELSESDDDAPVDAAAAAGGKKLTIEDEILSLPKRPAPLMRQLGLQ